MQKLFKNGSFFHLMLIVIFSITIMVSCTSNEDTKTEKTETVIEPKDSIPPLDTDSLSSTRPESIKN